MTTIGASRCNLRFGIFLLHGLVSTTRSVCDPTIIIKNYLQRVTRSVTISVTKMDKTTSLSFGDWVRRRRRALDLTQADLGERVGASAAMIRKVEADERRPSRELAELLAVALGVPATEHNEFLHAARNVAAVEKLSIADQPLVAPRPTAAASNLPAPMTSLVDRFPIWRA